MAEYQTSMSQADSSDDAEIITHEDKYMTKRKNICLALKLFLTHMTRHPNTMKALELGNPDMAATEAELTHDLETLDRQTPRRRQSICTQEHVCMGPKLTHDLETLDRQTPRRRQSICTQEHVCMGPRQTSSTDVQSSQTGRQGLGEAAYDDTRLRRSVSVDNEAELTTSHRESSSFQGLGVPDSCLSNLWLKTGIRRPTPIQAQGLPVIFSGRDMIGVAPTGSGKTLTLALPLVSFASQEERRMRVQAGGGPVGLVLCPCEEHARRTLDLIKKLHSGDPPLRSMLCSGGISEWRLLREIWERGVHIVVATPREVKRMLERRKIILENCTYVALEWVDRHLELGFGDDLQTILRCFRAQRQGAPRQTVMFSATMTEAVQRFAYSVLERPVVVKVGPTGAANLNVVQVVKHVNQAAKLMFLVKLFLRETPLPALIFCETGHMVQEVYLYLLWKGVAAVAVYGGQDQEERDSAISSFKTGDTNVLVATDSDSNGVDFPDIQHVINYDMPAGIQTYIHRIALTGQSGTTGLATSFINSIQPTTEILFYLKQFLKETKQQIPLMLAALEDPMEFEAEDQLSSTNRVQGYKSQ